MHIMKEKKPLNTSEPAKNRKIRVLKQEDMDVWGRATEDVTKFDNSNRVKDERPKGFKKHSIENISGKITLETFAAQQLPPKIMPQPSSYQVDANLKKRFVKGDLPIDGKIDLHGMTLAEAHHRFAQFITSKIQEGARYLLVVTGKGARGETREGTGVIRKNLPLWCEDTKLKPHILQIGSASAKHGGTGASYILLRRQK